MVRLDRYYGMIIASGERMDRDSSYLYEHTQDYRTQKDVMIHLGGRVLCDRLKLALRESQTDQ